MTDPEQLKLDFDPPLLSEVNEMPSVDRNFLNPLEIRMQGRVTSLSGRTINAAAMLGSRWSFPKTYFDRDKRVAAGLALVLFRLVDADEFDFLKSKQVFIGETSATREFISDHAHPALQEALEDKVPDIVHTAFFDREAEQKEVRLEIAELHKKYQGISFE